MTLRPFRFGIQASNATTRAEWASLAQRTEGHGYSVLTMPDHFGDQLAPVPAMMTALDVTSDLRVCALVFDNDYKHPVVLAKELATMDLLSDGRVEIGLGAGWMISDYEQLGIPYDTPGVRIDRFLEGLSIIKQCMQPGAFSHSGTHYTITGYDGLPKPVQAKMPVLIGGGGKRVLGIAAREADIVGINPSMHAGVVGPETFAHMSQDAVDEKIAIVRAAAGDRIDDIELNIRAFLVNVTEDGAGARDRLAGMLGVDTSMLLTSPFALIGSPSELVERLIERRERWGFSYVIVGADDVDKFAPVVAALAGK
ncbi:MAG TPA: TIGR03621 family F420-dependent LLM class oxidoreductase [Ilumatobacteraceae bacterium]|nr:TIGR03621 family F420-dependent LLM class oxidoreductase [Ilumatobacteraceae bacterium]HRB02976.1 TIGR03621 family F420-dependent LLM class oxidoreductase [Ilumatobacteraceae bacterium]